MTEAFIREPLEGGSLVELRQSTDSRYSWRVVIVADDNTEEALRKAKELAVQLDTELFEDLHERRKKWLAEHPRSQRSK